MGVWDDVGEALTGLMGRSQSHRGVVENREDEPWPGWMPESKSKEQALPQSIRPDVTVEHIVRRYGREPEGPPTRLSTEAGIEDIKRPTDAEILQHLLYIDYLNTPQGRKETEQYAPWLPDVEAEKGLSPREMDRVPLPRRRPIPRR